MSNSLIANIPSLADGTISIKLDATLTNGLNKTAVVSSDFKELLPWANLASEEAVDFFFLSTIIYGIDRFIPRRRYSVDGWSREINVTLPVYKLAKWKPCKQEFESLLSFLTGDYWTISFYKNTFVLPAKVLSPEYQGDFQQVNLFSGGLDSLIGAIDTLQNSKEPSLFISHYDPLMKGPKKDQQDLSDELTQKYGYRFVHLSSTRVYLEHSNLPRETTSRGRSLLFIGLALLLADAKKINIVVPENGTVSLNYPLSPSRRSACSTRTTHPAFLNLLEAIFEKLGITSKIENPYRFKTKGEMVTSCSDKAFLATILDSSNSCGKRGHRAHWTANGSHCGICMPCIYRQASLVTEKDSTSYGNKIGEFTDFVTKKSQDTGALLDFLHQKITINEIKFELIANGLKDQQNLYKYIDLIVRTRKELSVWVKKNGNKFVRAKAGL